MSNKPHGKLCKGCSGYGSVRVPPNYLNIWQPSAAKPEVLTEN